jgi:hypothetical protein
MILYYHILYEYNIIIYDTIYNLHFNYLIKI